MRKALLKGTRLALAFALLALIGGATTAGAAPVDRSADLTLTIEIQAVGTVPVTGTNVMVTVDEEADTLQIPALGVMLGLTPDNALVIPITGTTALASLTATTINNQAATFSIGGAGVGVPETETPCPAAGFGVACVNQTGVGGVMALGGTVNAVVFQGITLGLGLDAGRIGQGGVATVPNTVAGFRFDAAAWTLKTGSARFQETTVFQTTMNMQFTTPVRNTTVTQTVTETAMGSVDGPGSRLTLVTPTFVNALGNALPVFNRFTIAFTDGEGLPDFVPEPGGVASLLAGAGGLGLVALWRRRR